MQVRIEKRDWRIDPEAIERPWVIIVNDVEVARVSSVNASGDIARQYESDWDKIVKVF